MGGFVAREDFRLAFEVFLPATALLVAWFIVARLTLASIDNVAGARTSIASSLVSVTKSLAREFYSSEFFTLPSSIWKGEILRRIDELEDLDIWKIDKVFALFPLMGILLFVLLGYLVFSIFVFDISTTIIFLLALSSLVIILLLKRKQLISQSRKKKESLRYFRNLVKQTSKHNLFTTNYRILLWKNTYDLDEKGNAQYRRYAKIKLLDTDVLFFKQALSLIEGRKLQDPVNKLKDLDIRFKYYCDLVPEWKEIDWSALELSPERLHIAAFLAPRLSKENQVGVVISNLNWPGLWQPLLRNGEDIGGITIYTPTDELQTEFVLPKDKEFVSFKITEKKVKFTSNGDSFPDFDVVPHDNDLFKEPEIFQLENEKTRVRITSAYPPLSIEEIGKQVHYSYKIIIR